MASSAPPKLNSERQSKIKKAITGAVNTAIFAGVTKPEVETILNTVVTRKMSMPTSVTATTLTIDKEIGSYYTSSVTRPKPLAPSSDDYKETHKKMVEVTIEAGVVGGLDTASIREAVNTGVSMGVAPVSPSLAAAGSGGAAAGSGGGGVASSAAGGVPLSTEKSNAITLLTGKLVTFIEENNRMIRAIAAPSTTIEMRAKLESRKAQLEHVIVAGINSLDRWQTLIVSPMPEVAEVEAIRAIFNDFSRLEREFLAEDARDPTVTREAASYAGAGAAAGAAANLPINPTEQSEVIISRLNKLRPILRNSEEVRSEINDSRVARLKKVIELGDDTKRALDILMKAPADTDQAATKDLLSMFREADENLDAAEAALPEASRVAMRGGARKSRRRHRNRRAKTIRRRQH